MRVGNLIFGKGKPPELPDVFNIGPRPSMQPPPTGIPIGQQPRVPPTGGSGVTKTCDHDFVFLRDNYSGISDKAVRGLMPRIPRERVDTFYCRHCLEYREIKR